MRSSQAAWWQVEHLACQCLPPGRRHAAAHTWQPGAHVVDAFTRAPQYYRHSNISKSRLPMCKRSCSNRLGQRKSGHHLWRLDQAAAMAHWHINSGAISGSVVDNAGKECAIMRVTGAFWLHHEATAGSLRLHLFGQATHRVRNGAPLRPRAPGTVRLAGPQAPGWLAWHPRHRGSQRQ